MISYVKREMSSAGTMLSDLNSSAPDGDNDLVQRILADLNTTESPSNPVFQGGGGSSGAPPCPGSNGRVISSPNPNTTYPLAMDPATATAHLIGKSFPSSADFATMMGQGNQGGQGQGGQGGQWQGGAPAPPAPMLTQLTQGKGFLMDTINQFRQPILVALLFFIISLPVVNVMVAHYMPSLLRAGGDLTTLGLLAKSVLAGALFWIIINILAPLVSS